MCYTAGMKPFWTAHVGPLAAACLSIGLGAVLTTVSFAQPTNTLDEITRSYFPDRSWVPQTGADGASAGAGRAVEGTSSWMVNPANLVQIADSSKVFLRIGAVLLDTRRNDIAATTIQYSEESPFITFSENILAVPWKRWVFAAGIDQPGFHEEKNSFIDTSTLAFPVIRNNDVLSRLDRGSILIARKLDKVTVGVSFDAYRSQERQKSVPSEAAQQVGVGIRDISLEGVTFGGGLSVNVQPEEWLAFGAVARGASEFDLEDARADNQKVGTDQVPFSFDLGAHVGRGKGGNLLVDGRYTGKREVSVLFPDSTNTEAEVFVSNARWDFSGSYSYRHPEQNWEFRLGAGWQPRPADGGARHSRFGVGIGYNFEGLAARGSFSLDKRTESSGRSSDRRLFALSIDVGL